MAAAAAAGASAVGLLFKKGDTVAGGLGVLSSVIAIGGFVEKLADKDVQSVEIHFKIGIDGAHDPDDANAPKLKNAGGRMPDVRLFGERGKFLKLQTNDRTFCKAGEDDCKTTIKQVSEQPAYTLFTANDDAVCIAWAEIRYPSGDKYGWVGDWARACGAPWFYSDISIQSEKGILKPACVWLDSKVGDSASTGLQVHWPDYKWQTGQAAAGWDVDYYCHSAPTLTFYKNREPHSIKYLTRKRDLFSSDPSVATTPAQPRPDAEEREARRKIAKRQEVVDQRLIKSLDAAHSATVLCNSGSSQGPSLVSEHERTFCYMPTKTLYKFCEDLDNGHCWNNTAHAVDVKDPVGNAMASAPEYEFSKVLEWGRK